MSGPLKVIVLEPDPRAGRQVQLGFEREGVPSHLPVLPAEPAQLDNLAAEVPGLVLIGGVDGQAISLVKRARELVGPDVPIVSTAHGAPRAALEAAGADEVLARPTYLRDLVTICRILQGVPAGKRDHLVGSLVETTGVYALIRALSSLGRSAVLTLIRGLRRGEVRFYRGEVTSAEVGLIHGQAALHQLLLWTDARFDFAHEDIVRRQQIPLTPDELFADAERFLEGVREHAGTLSPATVLEQNVQRIQGLGKQVPTEVHGVLRMFDGHRVLADILEDSPYRVFETLRVAQKAVEAGLLKVLDSQRPKATWRAVLAIDEWLVGSDTREAVVERTAEIESGPVSTSKRKGTGKSRKRTKPATPAAGIRAEIDWGALVPRVIGGEVGQLAGVVPAQATAGEVTVATRDRAREKLEALMDTDKRDRIFPKDVGLEPKVVIAADDAATAKVVTATSEAETLSGPNKKKRRKKSDASGKFEKAPPESAANEKSDADAKAEQRAREAAEQNAREAQAEAREAQAQAREAAAKAQEAADLAAKMTREAEAKAREAAEAAEQQARVAASVERMRIEREQAEHKAREQARAKDSAVAAMIAIPSPQPTAMPARNPAAAVAATDATVSEPRERPAGRTDAKALVRELVAEAVPPSTAGAPRSEPSILSAPPLTPEPPRAKSPSAPPPIPEAARARSPVASQEDNSETTPFLRPSITPDPEGADPVRAHIAQPLNIVEAGHTRVAVADLVTVTTTDTTARVTSIPKVLISEEPDIAPIASTAPAMTASSTIVAPTSVSPPISDATPVATDDEPSDGVIRSTIAAADTARVAARARARAQRPTLPEHDGPEITEATGEIRERTPKTELPLRSSEPSILVADLAAAHTAIAAVVDKRATPPPADAASPAAEAEVAAVRRDAVELEDAEHEFFNRAESGTNMTPKFESFDDLDEGYQPVGFWDRVFGRKPKK